jgi:hypothetical protein
VGSEGNMSLKYRVTPRGIGPGTVRLVTQRLNHYATPDPDLSNIKKVMQSRNRPGVAQRVAVGLGSQIFMIFGT